MDHFPKNFIVEVLIFTLIVAAFLGGIAFFRTRINESAVKIAAGRQVMLDRLEILQSFSLLKSQYENKGQSYLNVLYNIIPTKDQLIDLRQEFQLLATKNNLGFGFVFSPGGEASAPADLDSLKFDLNVKGTIDQLLAFIRDLQSFKYLITLDSLSMNRQGSEIQMILKGQISYRP